METALNDRIVADPSVLAGKPIVRGTRMSVEFILELLSSGMDLGDVLTEYPQLRREDLLAALGYAATSLRHEEVYPLHE
ncbi:MAG: DUF433 domain-containing protein [Methanobacteriota archaeon]